MPNTTVGKKSSWKLKLVIFFVIILILGGGYFYYWISKTNELRTEAELSINKVKLAEELSQEIEKELIRCQDFITQREGNFSDFEYCKGYTQWYEDNMKNPLNN